MPNCVSQKNIQNELYIRELLLNAMNLSHDTEITTKSYIHINHEFRSSE